MSSSRASPVCGWSGPFVPQSKKRQYDQEVENLERQQKQTIERLEQEHTTRLRDEAKRIKADQDKELSKYQNMLKNRKKEVSHAALLSITFTLWTETVPWCSCLQFRCKLPDLLFVSWV